MKEHANMSTDELRKQAEDALAHVPEEHRRRAAAAGVGAAIGAIVGSVLGGPVGSAVGASLGGAVAVAVLEKSREKGGG